MLFKARLDRLVLRIPLVTLGAIFLAEATIMAGFALATGERRRWLEVVIDSSLLTLAVAPVLYWLIVRPLRTVADERSRLLARLIESQDTERQQIARDLHDQIGQSFTSLLVRMRLLEDAQTLAEARSLAAELRGQGGEVYDQIRNLARGLHPTVLDDLGLAAALERLAEDFWAAHSTKVTLQTAGLDGERFGRKVETAAYRIVQESLTNCAKYAQATHVQISLCREPRELRIVISDNGRGFDSGKTRPVAAGTTLGIANMRERALLLKGSFSIHSQPGGGTTVSVRLPLER